MSVLMMRSSFKIMENLITLRRNPLDLNSFPDDFSRDQDKQTLDDDDSSSASGEGMYRRKKKEESRGKVYECRFCSLKFCKSQALGGHMNRHRQERETEALNQARQLVFSNDNVLSHLSHHQGGHGGFHQQTGCNIGGSVYPARLFSGTSTTIAPPPPPHDYFVGHVWSGYPTPFSFHNLNRTTATNNSYMTCIGAPAGSQSFTIAGGNISGGKEMSQISPLTRYHQDGF